MVILLFHHSRALVHKNSAKNWRNEWKSSLLSKYVHTVIAATTTTAVAGNIALSSDAGAQSPDCLTLWWPELWTNKTKNEFRLEFMSETTRQY